MDEVKDSLDKLETYYPELRAAQPSMSYQFQYAMMYLDLKGTKRTINPGFNSGLTISKGKYPPGYKVSNGQPGGAYPSGDSNGTLPIRIVPVINGTGMLLFHTEFRIRVKNTGNQDGSFYCSLGTTSSSTTPDNGRPLYPYIGLCHDIDNTTPETIGPGEVKNHTGFRLDIVDDAYADVQNWPNWSVNPSSTTTKLHPAICPIFYNKGTEVLEVSDVFVLGKAY